MSASVQSNFRSNCFTRFVRGGGEFDACECVFIHFDSLHLSNARAYSMKARKYERIQHIR